MSATGLTCREIVELVSDYLDGELAPDVRASVDGHLTVCPGCLEYLSQMRTTIGSLRGMDTEDLAPSVVSRLMAAFSERSQEPTTGSAPARS